ncbi:hypothetical protein HB662_01615 [Roseomonas frigidaquae]|uniref:Uncharacterized protein n=1 Tax=Falsiroseomonas frigidaquae TaxID=487318 RepID=A0ABX1ESA1_9PROT|nr:hypothetical protein [Falsiroseomonas frigidaquae]NKE43457.1 hypothetical protein [Falsiroseomonas frigidaquae]
MADAARDEERIFKIIFSHFHNQPEAFFVVRARIHEQRLAELNDKPIPAAFASTLIRTIDRVIGKLHDKKLVTFDRDGDIILSPEGFFAGEQFFLLPDGADTLEADLQIPASDRVVRLTDNSAVRDEATNALDEVLEKLQTRPNDLPLNSEETSVSSAEISSLLTRIKTGFIRIGELRLFIGAGGLLTWLLLKLGPHALAVYVERAIVAVETLVKSLM